MATAPQNRSRRDSFEPQVLDKTVIALPLIKRLAEMNPTPGSTPEARRRGSPTCRTRALGAGTVRGMAYTYKVVEIREKMLGGNWKRVFSANWTA